MGGIVPVLANDQESRQNPAASVERNGLRVSDDPLGAAIRFLRGNAWSTGEEPFPLRKKIAIIQRRALIRWAEDSGLILDPAMWRDVAVIGGSEHDIWEGDDGEIWKVTRPDHFGWTVLPGFGGLPEISEATPLEYLERWQQANRMLGDDVVLRGIAHTDDGVQVIVSQPFVLGPYPEKREILRELQARGFDPVPGFSIGSEIDSTYFHMDSGLAMFDAASDNFILSHGVPIPVDVILMQPGARLLRQLLAADPAVNA